MGGKAAESSDHDEFYCNHGTTKVVALLDWTVSVTFAIRSVNFGLKMKSIPFSIMADSALSIGSN